jgi:hypothetical protein
MDTPANITHTKGLGADFEVDAIKVSTCTFWSKTLALPKDLETSMDVELSEQSSTTLEGDFTHPSEAILNAGCEPRNEENGERYFHASSNASGDHQPSFTESGTYVPNEEIEDVDSEDFEPISDSDAEILTFPSPDYSRAMHKLERPLNSVNREEESINEPSGIVRSRSRSSSFVNFECGGIVRDTAIKDQSRANPQTARQAGPQIVIQAMSSMELDSVSVSGTSVHSMDDVNKRHPSLLFTEEEAARVVTTREIITRSARYSSNGVAIPNFYCVLEDEESDTEKTMMPANRNKTSSNEMHSSGCATHSAIKGVTFPDLLNVSEHDQDDESEEAIQNLNGQTVEAPTSSDDKESTDGASVVNANTSDFQYHASLASIDCKYNEQSLFSPSTRSITQAAATYETPSGLVGDLEAVIGTPKAEDQVAVTNTNGFKTSILQIPNGKQTQDTAPSGDTDSSPRAPSSTAQALPYSAPPIVAPYPPPLFKPGLNPAQVFDKGPPVFGPSHSIPLPNRHTSFGSAGDSSQTISQLVTPQEQHRESPTVDGSSGFQNSVTSRPLAQFAAPCTYCGERTTPSEEARQVFCSGCGPGCDIRYCSVSCLLVDSLDHARHCMNYPASSRATYYNLPTKYFVYILNPIMPRLDYFETPERFRQKAFSMYCSTGSFPTIFMAWMKKASVTYPSPQLSDIREAAKRTGDYVVFRSNATGSPTRNNPNAEVIFT